MIRQDLPELVASYFEVHRLQIVEGSLPNSFTISPIPETPVTKPELCTTHDEVK
jgi:hypothetical protein